MRILILYVPIATAVILPFLFPRTHRVRVLSIVILCVVALLHFTYLMAGHRFVIEEGMRQLAIAPGNRLPADFDAAVSSMQKHNQQEMWSFAALTVAFVLLALMPASRRDPKP